MRKGVVIVGDGRGIGKRKCERGIRNYRILNIGEGSKGGEVRVRRS